eukprot:2619561-Rhodomonas_salina.1
MRLRSFPVQTAGFAIDLARAENGFGWPRSGEVSRAREAGRGPSEGERVLLAYARACYAMSGTELVYWVIGLCGCLVWSYELPTPNSVLAYVWYAIPGTDPAYHNALAA